MSKNNDDLKIKTIELLIRWGEWCKHGTSRNIGYPKACAFVHAGETRSSDADVMLTDEDAERVEAVMCGLKRHQRQIFDVLAAWYVFGLDLGSGAKRLSVSYGSFRDAKRQGEALVQGILFSEIFKKTA